MLVVVTRFPARPRSPALHGGSHVHCRSVRAAFAPPPIFQANGQNVFSRIGTLARDQVYGRGQRAADLSLQKNIKFTEKYVLELHGDTFNITNNPQFTNPDGTLIDSNYGKVTGTELDSQRELQLATRFTF